MTGKIPQERNNLRTGAVVKGPSGKDLGDCGEGTKNPHPLAYHSMSPHSICKKSPNLLAALLSLPDSGLKQY